MVKQEQLDICTVPRRFAVKEKLCPSIASEVNCQPLMYSNRRWICKMLPRE